MLVLGWIRPIYLPVSLTMFILKKERNTSRGCNEIYLLPNEARPMMRRDGGRSHAQQPMRKHID